MAERYKLGDIDNERFYQVPKSLFINPKYKSMSNTSKMMYAILKDRMELSRKNGWHDENNDIFLLFDQQDMADLLGTSRVTINRYMKELKVARLIEPIRQGLGKPNKIYINKPQPYSSEHQDVSGVQHQDVSDLLHQDVSDLLHQNVSEFNSSDTEVNDTEISDTKSQSVCQPSDIPSIDKSRLVESTDTQTDELQPLIDFYQANIEILTPFKLQDIQGMYEDFGSEWLQKAMEKVASCEQSKRNNKYLRGVLKGWKKDGVPKPWEQKKKQEPAQCFESDFIIG